jgi:hypothetical protein
LTNLGSRKMNAPKIGLTYRAIASITGSFVHRKRSPVLFLCVEKRMATAAGAQRFMRGVE